MQHSEYINNVITQIEDTLGPDFFDWIDAPEGQAVGLKHVAPDEYNRNPLHIDAGLHTEALTEAQLDNAHRAIEQFADDHGISVDLVESNPDSCVYRFSLHAQLLGGNTGSLGRSR